MLVLDALGWVYYRKGEARRALGYLQTVQKKLPENPEVNHHLGMALGAEREVGRGERHLQKSPAGKKEFIGKEDAAKTLAGI